MHHITTARSGFSLVEVLVAISILLLAIIGPMTIAAQALQTAQFTREQNTAFFLAQEGIEIVMAMRAQYALEHFADPSGTASFDWLSESAVQNCDNGSNGCGFHFDDEDYFDDGITCASNGCVLYYDETDPRARYSHNAAGGTESRYVRRVFIDGTAGTGVQVTSQVTWLSRGQASADKTVELQTYIYDIYNTN